MKNIGFNDSGYIIKPPQPCTAIYGAPPFTGNHCDCLQVYQPPEVHILICFVSLPCRIR